MNAASDLVVARPSGIDRSGGLNRVYDPHRWTATQSRCAQLWVAVLLRVIRPVKSPWAINFQGTASNHIACRIYEGMNIFVAL